MSMPLAAVHLADGPAMYFGGTIMTFALPMGAFIVTSIALFYLFRAQHSGPRLKYLATAAVHLVRHQGAGPRPGPAGAPRSRPRPRGQETATRETAPQETATDPETAQATEEPEE